MKSAALWLGALAAIALQGSAFSQVPTQHRLASTPDEQACVAGGGHLECFGKAEALYCVKPLADGGKACSRKADCLGVCLADYTAPESRSATGRCQARDEPLRGCFAVVDDRGKARKRCID